MSKVPRIGFIGLGLMGQAFTRRLRECGYTVTGYDINADKVERAEAHGGIAVLKLYDPADSV